MATSDHVDEPKAFEGYIYVTIPDREGFFLRCSKSKTKSKSKNTAKKSASSTEFSSGDGSKKSDGTKADRLSNVESVPPFYVLTMDPSSGTAATKLEKYVRDALDLSKVSHDESHEELRGNLGCTLQSSILLHFEPEKPDQAPQGPKTEESSCYLQRCLVCVMKKLVEEKDVDRLWRKMAKLVIQWEQPELRVWKFESLPSTEGKAQLFRCRELGVDSSMAKEAGDLPLAAAGGHMGQYRVSDGPSISPGPAPLFDHASFNPVFRTWKKTHDILLKCADLEPVKRLLEIVKKKLPNQDFAKLTTDVQLLHPFVVVEGMDAAGKTTLTEKLEESPRVLRLSSPPPCLMGLRREFDAFPEIVRRAYYCVGNFIMAKRVIKECRTRTVILDRFWQSTAAYGIANETSHRELPTVGHEVYCWPEELLKPSVVLFLTISEDERRKRLQGRSDQQTCEEKELTRNKNFRDRLCEAYKRMRDPACVLIDASGSKESVFKKTISKLKELGIEL